MAYYNERWPERQHPRDYDRQDWRDWDRDRDRNMWNRDRSMWDRTRDEVRSWAGDEDAERRRRWDEMRDRNWEYGRRDYVPWERPYSVFGGTPGYDRYGTPTFERGWGPYYGRGPRGYQRSDERIREDVCDRLTDAPDVDASDIDIQVVNREVTLRGNVGTRLEKRRAEDIAEQISGVNDVHNEIKVTGERAGVSELDLTGRRTPSSIGETPHESARTR
jgi:BON domain-containing protein